MQPGDILEVETTALAHGGSCVARADGRVLFVPDSLPGERLVVRVSRVKRSYAHAEALEVRDASPFRREHVWPEADISRAPEERVGGADLGHIALEHQRTLKAGVLAESLERFAGIRRSVALEPAVADREEDRPDGLRWRTRMGLHVDDDGRVGAFSARSHRVVQTGGFPLSSEALAEAARRLGPQRPGRIDLVEPSTGGVRVIPRPDARRGSSKQASQTVLQRVAGRDFEVAAGGFWQVHRLAAGMLHAAVAEAVGALPDPGGAEHLDLYGGVGLLADATLTARPADRVTVVESSPLAAGPAQRNLSGRPARVVSARVERWLASIHRDADAVQRAGISRGVAVLDPPRAGAGREVIAGVIALAPLAVVYVACDPVALSRDAALLAQGGYRPESIRAFDLFPHSHHLEALAVFQR